MRRASACITRHIEQALSGRQPRLPRIRQLAAEAQVSLVTAGKALKHHPQYSRLDVVQGNGIWLKGNAPKAEKLPTFPARPPKWRSVSQTLLRRMHAGMYPPQQFLPSISALQDELGVCAPVLREAMHHLQQQGHIVAYKRHFRVQPLGVCRRMSTVAIVTLGTPSAGPGIFTQRDELLYQLLSTRATELGLREKFVSLPWKDVRESPTAVLAKRLAALRREAALIGVIVRTSFMERPAEVVAAAAATRLPVAVLEELREPLALPRGRRTLSFRLCDDCGRRAASFLLDKGYRDFVHIAAYPESYWSMRRLQGVREAVAQWGLAADCVRAVHAQRMNRNEYMNAQLEGIGFSADAGPIPYSPGARQRFETAARGFLKQEYLRYHMEPVFESICAGNRATAWICDSDAIAYIAREFLHRKRKRIPKECSLVGFDNSLLAISAGITSYDFNIQAVVASMFNHIVAPELSPAVYPDGVARINGFLIERGTTTAPE